MGKWIALVALAAGVSGCASAPALTELVVVVRADLPVPALRITVTTPEGTVPIDARLASPTMPVSMVLTRDHAAYGPITVHVEGGGVVSEAQTSFVPGERRRLDVVLSSSCLCASCMAPQTCSGGVCVDRAVAASSLPRWDQGSDASVAPGRDGGAVSEAGLPDAGPSGPTCGCSGQACCAGTTCNGMLSCRSSVCMNCVSTDPGISGMTPTAATMFLSAISGVNDTLYVSSSDGTNVGQVPFALTGGLTSSGTAPLTQILSITTSGSTMHVIGPSGAMGTITFAGATLTGSFSPTMGPITRASASGHVLTLTARDGSTGMITFVPTETCR